MFTIVTTSTHRALSEELGGVDHIEDTFETLGAARLALAEYAERGEDFIAEFTSYTDDYVIEYDEDEPDSLTIVDSDHDEYETLAILPAAAVRA